MLAELALTFDRQEVLSLEVLFPVTLGTILCADSPEADDVLVNKPTEWTN